MARRYALSRVKQKGDTLGITLTHAYGFITGSGKDLNIALPIAFFISSNVKAVTFDGQMQARQNGVYLYGNSNGPEDVDPIVFNFGNILQATYSFATAPAGVTNNDCVAITLANGTLTFN